jgi:hypothetical protein
VGLLSGKQKVASSLRLEAKKVAKLQAKADQGAEHVQSNPQQKMHGHPVAPVKNPSSSVDVNIARDSNKRKNTSDLTTKKKNNKKLILGMESINKINMHPTMQPWRILVDSRRKRWSNKTKTAQNQPAGIVSN